MAKKNFDSFLDTVKVPKPTISEIEAMTREIHELSKPAPPIVEPFLAPEKVEIVEKAPTKKANPQSKKAPKTVLIAAEKADKSPITNPQSTHKRGRKPNPPEFERLIRVSVDLPESTIIELKGRVTRERTDMKNFIRQLVEKELLK